MRVRLKNCKECHWKFLILHYAVHIFQCSYLIILTIQNVKGSNIHAHHSHKSYLHSTATNITKFKLYLVQLKSLTAPYTSK
jgi:hypothetical protein